jgi:transcriptional regulator with XRE-family HTH domain
MMERGERQPTVRVLFQLAGALNVLPVKLIELTQELVGDDQSASS